MTSPVYEPPEAAASPPEDEESRAVTASTAATATTTTTITIPSVLVFIPSPSRPSPAGRRSAAAVCPVYSARAVFAPGHSLAYNTPQGM